MTVQQGPETPDVRDERKTGTLRLLLRLLDRPTRWRLVIAAALSGALALLETVAIVTVLPLVQIATGAPLDDGATGLVWNLLGKPGRGTFGMVLVGVVVGLFILKDVLAVAFVWWQSGFVMDKRVEMSTRLFQRFLREPLAEFRRRNIGEAIRTMTAAVGQVFTTVSAMITTVSSGLTVTAILAALLVTTPVQALLALLYFSVAALAYLRVVRPRISQVGDDIMEGTKEATIAGLQGLQGFKEVKVRGSARHFIERFTNGLLLNERAAREGNFFSSITKYLLEILFILGVGALLAVSFLSGAENQAVGSLALFVAAGFRLLPNISSLVGSVNGFRIGRASVLLVAEELRDAGPLAEPTESRENTSLTLTTSLRIEDVRYRYPGAEREVLRGIDLDIPAGSSVAFVGSSGAGKTTLVDLVLGLLTPTRGTIRADGVDIAEGIDSWQRICGVVAQDVFIAEDTVRKNILFDVPVEEADEQRLRQAVRMAQLEDVVEALPDGLDGDVGDWGSRLSGGQRQRLGIARALYRSPRLLVLDEATSALDNETERRVTETVNALHGDMTVIVVAHRLSTVKNVDTVVYMEDGRISGMGSFEELRRSNAGFAHLVQLGDLSMPPNKFNSDNARGKDSEGL
ncbi:ABC transporter ATP-binding protein [Brachybacterium sp. AOP42-B2-9]|uniref:ABC transporter ATP-binding protein n=1 Tax=Brachybacterium sp. AOP42-B2-9 TaxID=3457672 RepID=UPI0040333210